MATIKPQQPDKAKDAKADALAAQSVPELRDAVAELAEATEALEVQIAKLQARGRKAPG